MDPNVVMSSSNYLPKSNQNLDSSHLFPRSSMSKRLSIFLPSTRNNSIFPSIEEQDKDYVPRRRSNFKHLTHIPMQKAPNLRRNESIVEENLNRVPTTPFIRTDTNMMQDSARLFLGDIDDKSIEYYEDPEIDFKFKDAEERNMLYQQIQEIIMKDDNEDFFKRGLLLDDENEQENFWTVDSAVEFQKEADRYAKLQEEQQFLYCERKNPFELIKMYADPYPLLEIRKVLAYYSRKISMTCEQIIKKPYFDNLVLVIIIWNCVLLALEDPTLPATSTEALMEQMLLICYSIEMGLKIIGLGFIFNRGAYLRDGWNILDFTIIVTSYLPYIFSNDSSSFKFSSLRTLRVLRPLRTISSIKSLKNLLVTLFSSMPLLLDILLFLLFFFVTFAMIGVHLFSGKLKQRCFSKETGIMESLTEVCGYATCDVESFCGKGLDNPYYGVMNFDNLLFSLVMGFQCVTLQAWTVIMVEVIKAYSIFVVVYFITLVFFGSLFLLNLTLAVIKSKFTDTQKLKESLGKAVVKKISEVQINELRLLKKIERSHFKRMKNQKNNERIGASEEGRPGTNRFNEITWDDLLQLKEMIREERLREEEEERFEILRRERVKSDDMEEERRLLYYIRKVQELKKNALRIFLKKGDNMTLINKSMTTAIKSVKQNSKPKEKKTSNVKIKIIPEVESKASLDEAKETRIMINSPNMNSRSGSNSNFSFEKTPKNNKNNLKFDKSPKNSCINDPKTATITTSHRKESKSPTDKKRSLRKSMTTFDPENDKSPRKILRPSKIHAEKTGKSPRHSKKPKEDKNKNFTGSFRLNKIIPSAENDTMMTPRNNDSPKEGSSPFLKPITPFSNNHGKENEINSFPDIIEKEEEPDNNDLIEDPSNFPAENSKPPPKHWNSLCLNFKDLKIKKIPIVQSNYNGQSMKSLKSIPSFNMSQVESGMSQVIVINAIKEEAENEDQDQIEAEDVMKIEETVGGEKSSFESDLLNDSDFNDSFTLNKAKMEAILQVKKNAENSLPPTVITNGEEIEGLDTKLSDRPLISKKTEDFNKKEEAFKSQTSGLKRLGTIRKLKHNNSGSKLNKMLNFGERFKNSSKHLLSTIDFADKKPNVRDFNLMVDSEREYYGFSLDDVLENRILYLVELNKRKEMEAIATLKFKIELRPISFDSFSQDLLQQIKDNRRKMNTGANAKKRKFNLALRTNWVFKDNGMIPPTIILRKHFLPHQASFSKSSITKSPRKTAFSKKKRVQIKLDDELEFKYETIATKINEQMIEKRAKEKEEQEEEDFLEIHRMDRKKEMKCLKVWSGNEVLPMKIFLGDWTVGHINSIFNALSFSKQDKLIWLKTMKGKLLIAHKYLKRFLNGKCFEKIILLIVLLNTIILCFDGMFTDEKTMSIQNSLFYFFDILFVIEFGLKFMAYGPTTYLRDVMNIFDGFVATMSLLELTVVDPSSYSAIKVFRVLRVARLLRSIAFMHMIVNIITRALKSFIYIALLLLLFLFIYTLLGMQLFGGAFQSRNLDLSQIYRENFDSFTMAFITTFQVLTGTAWQQLLYLSYGSSTNIFLMVAYVVSWIFIGNYVLLNLFLAIILDEFTKDENYQVQTEDSFDYSQEIISKDTIETAATSQNQLRLESSYEISPNNQKDDTKKEEKRKLFQGIQCKRSMWFFSKRNKIRIFCYKMANNSAVENFWLSVIMANAICMIIETYITSSETLNVLNVVFFAFFSLELIIKVISAGFFMGKGSYLRDYWNVLDFIIVSFSLVDLSVESLNFSVVKGFRVLRMLRPLRLISHNVNMKIVVTALLDSITSIFNILLVILLTWLMFAILGISMLKDKMGKCEVEEYYGIGYEQCIEEGERWVVANTNFDNIYNAMITLFVISSRELWIDIMYLCIDAGDQSTGPFKDHYPQMQYYFIGFILLGSYFLLNLLVGVIFYNFNKAKRNEQNKSMLFLTEEQAKWLNIQKMIAQVKPDFLSLRKPKNPFRLRAFILVTHKYYEKAIMAVIGSNILILGIYYDTAPIEYIAVLDNLVMGFEIFYVTEVSMKIVGLGIKAYWYDSWNRFDFFLTCFSFINILFWTQDLRNLITGFLFVFEIFKILRILRLLKMFKGALKLLETLLFSLPPLINVGALLMLIIFVYAVLGVSLFSNITHGEIIDEYNNFKNFGYAMLVLFKVMTGDEWFEIMFDLYHKPEGCETTNSCGSIASIFYFISFFLICAYIMLNLFILIIIQQFEDFHLKEDNPINNFKKNLNSFSKIWAEFTESSFGITIPSKKLIDFYMRLDPPLGFGVNSERPKVALEIMKMNLTGDEMGNIYFNELLFASMKRLFGQEILNNVSKEIQEMMESQEKQIKARLERRTLKMINSFYAESPTSRPRSKATSKHLSPLKQDNNNNNNKQIVNPMITILFVGMVFKSWKRYMEHFIKKELDPNGNVICAKKEEYSDDEIEEEDDDDDNASYSDGEENSDENGFGNNSDSDSENESNSENYNDDEVENEERESGNSDQKEEKSSEEDNEEKAEEKDKQSVAFNMIGKFIIKKNKADEVKEEDKEETANKRHGSNIFRTFFASNQNKERIKKT